MKVIFLDVDGVLNNTEHVGLLVKLLGDVQYRMLMHDLDGAPPFDEESCALVRKLVEETEAKVVLSSTWRFTKDSVELVEKMLGFKVMDITPKTYDRHRGTEIQQYLTYNKDITNYVIIDDDTDMLASQKDHFVHVSTRVGFDMYDYNKAKEILMKEEKVDEH